jgi:hypothetical protein
MDSALLSYFYGYTFETKLIAAPHLDVEISKEGRLGFEQLFPLLRRPRIRAGTAVGSQAEVPA